MCVDVHGLTPTKLNNPAEAEFLVSHCYQADLRHKHEENQGFIQPMCSSCVKKIRENPDLYIFSIYSLKLEEINTPEEKNG
tara:strand:+ start:32 stop:274 length:243 start_codon:yes stop_codon:yes gene_type:complete